MLIAEIERLAKDLHFALNENPARFLHHLAFRCYLKTGAVPTRIASLLAIAKANPRMRFKYNHNHDELGRFTFGDGGGDSTTVVAMEEEKDPLEEIDPLAEARTEQFQSALSRLREIDPNNRELERLTSPTWTPNDEDIARINNEIADVIQQRNTALLMPNGAPLGNEGSRFDFRELPGGKAAAENLFAQLTRGGILNNTPSYIGIRYQLPGNTYVGYREISSYEDVPTIDINIPTLNFITKLKFPSSGNKNA